MLKDMPFVGDIISALFCITGDGGTCNWEFDSKCRFDGCIDHVDKTMNHEDFKNRLWMDTVSLIFAVAVVGFLIPIKT